MKGCTCHGDLTLCPWCASLAQRAGVVTSVVPALSESAWQRAVIRLATDAGWMTYHVHDSRRSPHGWPDLACAHPTPGHPLYLVELKTDVGECTRAQIAWLAALQGSTGVISGVWRPSMIDHVRDLFQGDPHA